MATQGTLHFESSFRTNTEEFLHALTHGLGALMGTFAAAALMSRVLETGEPWLIGGCAFYSFTLILVYVASTLSHLPFQPETRHWLERVDQGCIYLFIVGTFTPIALRYLESPLWLGFFGLTLAVAIGGFLSKTVFARAVSCGSVWLYLTLGWGEAITCIPMYDVFPKAGMGWMVVGGLCYTIGTVFLIIDNRRYHFHTIWHLFVMAGSAAHFVAIYGYVVAS